MCHYWWTRRKREEEEEKRRNAVLNWEMICIFINEILLYSRRFSYWYWDSVQTCPLFAVAYCQTDCVVLSHLFARSHRRINYNSLLFLFGMIWRTCHHHHHQQQQRFSFFFSLFFFKSRRLSSWRYINWRVTCIRIDALSLIHPEAPAGKKQ